MVYSVEKAAGVFCKAGPCELWSCSPALVSVPKNLSSFAVLGGMKPSMSSCRAWAGWLGMLGLACSSSQQGDLLLAGEGSLGTEQCWLKEERCQHSKAARLPPCASIPRCLLRCAAEVSEVDSGAISVHGS